MKDPTQALRVIVKLVESVVEEGKDEYVTLILTV